MGRASRARTERRLLARFLQLQQTQIDQFKSRWWRGPGLRKAAFGTGISLLSYPVVQIWGLRPELIPAAAIAGLSLIGWAVTDIDLVKRWLSNRRPITRSGIYGVVSVLILGLAAASWVMVGRSVDAVTIGGYPKFRSRQEVRGVSKGGACPGCIDEIDLDGAGTLYIAAIGRGFVEMALSLVPTVELNNPLPGKIPLPMESGEQSRVPNAVDPSSLAASETMPVAAPERRPETGVSPSDVNANPRGGTATVTIGGSASPGHVSIEHITIPPSFRGRLKIRDRKSVHRFDVAGERQQNITIGDRTFAVTLAGISESSSPDRQHTIYRYTFNIAER